MQAPDHLSGPRRSVRKRTTSYGIVRERTASYGIVRVRTRTYGNVQNAFRRKLVPIIHLRLSRGVLGSSAANFGVVFGILASWGSSYQHSAFSVQPAASRGCHGLACVAMYAVATTPRPGFPNPNLEIRRKSQAPSSKLKSSEIGKTAVSTQHSAFSLPPKKQRQSARSLLLSLADRFCIVNQRVGCCSFAAHGS